MRSLVFALVFLGVSAGCGPTPMNTPYPTRNRNVLLVDEITAAKGMGGSAYDMIAQLRPEFLRSRGATSLRNTTPPTAIVYLDGVKYGDLQSLRQISGEHVTRVDYLNGSEATTRFGTDHVGGAIIITTK